MEIITLLYFIVNKPPFGSGERLYLYVLMLFTMQTLWKDNLEQKWSA